MYGVGAATHGFKSEMTAMRHPLLPPGGTDVFRVLRSQATLQGAEY